MPRGARPNPRSGDPTPEYQEAPQTLPENEYLSCNSHPVALGSGMEANQGEAGGNIKLLSHHADKTAVRASVASLVGGSGRVPSNRTDLWADWANSHNSRCL